MRVVRHNYYGASRCHLGYRINLILIMLDEAFQRGWENLFRRMDGPMSIRFIIQPVVASLLAIRAGLKDAREGQPPFLWGVFRGGEQRSKSLRHGWREVRMVFIVALILDAIYQVIAHSGIYTLELLVVASSLALVPYVLIRGLVTRLARLRRS